MDTDKITEFREQQAKEAQRKELLTKIDSSANKVAKEVSSTLIAIDKNKKNRTVKVDIQNDIATKSDIKNLVKTILAVGKNLKPEQQKPIIDALTGIANELSKLPKAFPEYPKIDVPKPLDSVKITNLSEVTKAFEETFSSFTKTIDSIEFSPNIEVKPADVIVKESKLDLGEINSQFEKLLTAVESIKLPAIDMSDFARSIDGVKQSIDNLTFPVPNYVLPFKDSSGKATQVTLTADGKVPVEAGATSNYESRNDTTTDTNLVYLGKALPGSATSDAAWQIKRYNKSAGHMSFADDETTFTKVWSDRTTYNY